MKIKIKVTKAILRMSAFCGTEQAPGFISTNCAIALAIRDIFPDAQVSNKIVTWVEVPFGKSDEIQLPVEAVRFIREFDTATVMQRSLMPEFEFEVNIPTHIVDCINIDDIHKSKTLEVAL